MDALLTQRKLAEAVLAQKGDYMMMVKDNQPELRKWIRALFEEPMWLREIPARAETLDLGHGRIERRQLQASGALSDHQLWPGLAQVFVIERTITGTDWQDEPGSGLRLHEFIERASQCRSVAETGARALDDRESKPLGQRCDLG
jgi:hypothetical protein